MNWFQKHYGTGWGPIGGIAASIGLCVVGFTINWIVGMCATVILFAVWFFNRNTK